MNIFIQAELPTNLLIQVKTLVDEGWASDLNEILADALRRYLESHSSALTESFIREDVEWACMGKVDTKALPERSTLHVKPSLLQEVLQPTLCCFLLNDTSKRRLGTKVYFLGIEL